MQEPKVSFAGYTFDYYRGCIICGHVFEATEPIFQVAHDTDGWLQFHCSHEDHKPHEAKTAALGELLKRYPGLSEVPCTQPGEYTTIQPDGSWVVRPM